VREAKYVKSAAPGSETDSQLLPASVVDQPEERRKVLTRVRVTRTEETIGPDDREPHRVLEIVSHASCGALAFSRTEEAGVSCDEERPVGRVDTEAVDVNGSSLSLGTELRFPVPTPQHDGHDRSHRDGWQREPRHSESRSEARAPLGAARRWLLLLPELPVVLRRDTSGSVADLGDQLWSRSPIAARAPAIERQLSAHRRHTSAQFRITSSSAPIASYDSAQRSQASAQTPHIAACSSDPRSMKSREASHACAQSRSATTCSAAACSPPRPRQYTSVSTHVVAVGASLDAFAHLRRDVLGPEVMGHKGSFRHATADPGRQRANGVARPRGDGPKMRRGGHSPPRYSATSSRRLPDRCTADTSAWTWTPPLGCRLFEAYVGGRRPAIVSATSRRAAALDGRLPAAARA